MKRIFICIAFLLVSALAFSQAIDAPAAQPAQTPTATQPQAPVTPDKPVTPPGSKAHLFKGAKLYIAPIEGGYDIYLTAALQKKQVPVTVVTDRSKADFEIAGVTETEKAGWAKMLFMGNDSSNEQASIKVADIKSGEIVFGYNVNKRSSAKGKQSSSEACAKHIKENIEEAK